MLAAPEAVDTTKNGHAIQCAFITGDGEQPCNRNCKEFHTKTTQMAKISHGLCRRTTEINLNDIPVPTPESPHRNYFNEWARTDFCEGSLEGCQMSQGLCVRHQLGYSHFKLLDKGQHSATLTREKFLRLVRDMLADRSGTQAEEDWRRHVVDGIASRIVEEERRSAGLRTAV
ncbi:hypothetical protein AC578_2632 [Pseudocercospora eumusae]|uniref:Uncharacterized protein n=1 Tax=Pseudocercospora eumusae TaxID=321146 RepID=A0A139H0I5_9PEZI|nr:hypothetical protein AC578_2632 [Pseudocercospora eumusae]